VIRPLVLDFRLLMAFPPLKSFCGVRTWFGRKV
jgi:hypothetical protein